VKDRCPINRGVDIVDWITSLWMLVNIFIEKENRGTTASSAKMLRGVDNGRRSLKERAIS
jgi:hypothetical protein